MDNFHTPVLLEEAIQALDIQDNGIYIDATIGGGGHTEEILKRGGRVLGIDQDESAHLHLKKKFESEISQGKLILEHGNFADIEKLADRHKITGVNGILFDLGVSSYQIDHSGRGFSFQKSEPLDMRMDSSMYLTAGQILNTWSEEDLYNIFAKYGEETKARQAANAVVIRRKQAPIETTLALAEIVSKVVPNTGQIHPATKIFQALRIATNNEIDNLRTGLHTGFKLLLKGGVLCVISFHSLEDRVVKLYFLELVRASEGKIMNKKPITATLKEIRMNRRSRSAKMRVINKI